MEEPLKYTCRGNVPISSLREEIEWKKEGRVLLLHRVYFDKETGEFLANDINGYVLPPTLWQRLRALFGEAGQAIALSGVQAKAGGSL